MTTTAAPSWRLSERIAEQRRLHGDSFDDWDEPTKELFRCVQSKCGGLGKTEFNIVRDLGWDSLIAYLKEMGR